MKPPGSRALLADCFVSSGRVLGQALFACFALALGVTLLWLAGAVAAGLILSREIDAVFDAALQEVTQRILPLAYRKVLKSGPRHLTRAAHGCPIKPQHQPKPPSAASPDQSRTWLSGFDLSTRWVLIARSGAIS